MVRSWNKGKAPGIPGLREVDNNDEDGAEGGAHVEAGAQVELAPVGEGGGEVDGAHPLPLHYLVQAPHAAAPTVGIFLNILNCKLSLFS
jgi:hypothetical protein